MISKYIIHISLFKNQNLVVVLTTKIRVNIIGRIKNVSEILILQKEKF